MLLLLSVLYQQVMVYLRLEDRAEDRMTGSCRRLRLPSRPRPQAQAPVQALAPALARLRAASQQLPALDRRTVAQWQQLAKALESWKLRLVLMRGRRDWHGDGDGRRG